MCISPIKPGLSEETIRITVAEVCEADVVCTVVPTQQSQESFVEFGWRVVPALLGLNVLG